jgi:hypothetical protein
MSNAQSHYTQDPSVFPANGGCVCGLIRYTITTTPLIVHCCHCTACQREQGSAFAINIVIENSKFELLGPLAKSVIPSCNASTNEGNGEDVIYATPEMAPPSELGIEKCPGGIYVPAMIALPTQSGSPHTIARCPRCFVAVYSEYGGSGPHRESCPPPSPLL